MASSTEAERAIALSPRLDPKNVAARYARAVLDGDGPAEDVDTLRRLSSLALTWGRR